MGTITLTDTVNGTVSDVNANLNNNWSVLETAVNGGLDASNLAALSVTEAKLATNAVTINKIANNAVTNVKLADNAVGTAELVDGAVTEAKLAAALLDSIAREVVYQTFIVDVPVTATSVGTSNQIVSSGAIAYTAVEHDIEFFCPSMNVGAQTVTIILRDSTTVLGTLAQVDGAGPTIPLLLKTRLTPTAASHTYNIAAWVASASTSLFEGGSGGSSGDSTTLFPGYIRVTRVATL